jgi:peptide/nickel transport system permease protein
MTVFGFSLVALLCLVAIAAPWLTPYDAYGMNPQRALLPPSHMHWLGTDELGRDIFTRIVYGTRLSLTVGVATVALAASIGIVLGNVAGITRGGMDDLVMRTADIFLAFPPLILAMAVVAALGPGLSHAMVAVAFVWWPGYARLMRGQVLTITPRLFVEAAYAVGASRRRVMFIHILPNCLTPLLVKGSLDIGYAILLMASLGFVGLGAPLPTPEWGTMLATARRYLLDQWWYPTFIGFGIFVAVLGFSLLGDGLQTLFDPRLRRST